MKNITRYMLLIGILIALISCGGSGENTEENILIVGRPADAIGFDPARETDGESFAVTSEIFEGLVGFKPGTTQIEPLLAESWSYSEDNLLLTFKLRKHVKFHDGTPFNADAVLFNFERQYDTNNSYNKFGPWKYWGYMNFSEIIDTIIKVDDYTIEFNLQKTDASFLASLAMSFIGMVSPTAVKKHEAAFSNNPVGTGPYKFMSWTKGDSTVLVKNEKYWGAVPKVSKVVMKVIPDPTARVLALKNGEIDIAMYPSPDDISSIKSDATLDMIDNAGLNIGYLAFNTEKKPFDDVRVRQALNYAVDKQAIIQAAYGDIGSALDAPIPPSMWAYNPNIPKYEYNPEKAIQLLADAGYPNGFEAEMLALPVTRPYIPKGAKVAEIIQQQFAQVGVTANIQTVEWGTHLERTDHGDYEMAFLGWIGDNGDPDNFLGVLLAANRAVTPASNIARWKNKEFSDLISEAVEISDTDTRQKLYFLAQEIFVQDAPWVVIANSRQVVPKHKKVKNLVITPVAELLNLKDVYIEE